MPRFFPLVWLLVPITLFLLLTLLWHSLPSEAAPALGLTPTSTSTSTRVSVETPTPTRPPTSTPKPKDDAPDLVIVKRGEPTEVFPGEEVTFTLEVTNRGQESAVGVVVTDEISEYLEILEVTTTQGTVTIEGQTVTVEVGVVGPDFVVEIVIRTRVRDDTPAPLEIENVAVLSSPNGGDRISQTIILKVSQVLPVTGRLQAFRSNKLLWGLLLAVVLLAGGVVAAGIRMSRRDAAR
jgi:uncharacterized repeat protein (TIGR01451 family)